ncbi:MAG: AIR synthase-related protein, partial [Phenylobacterium sp.]
HHRRFGSLWGSRPAGGPENFIGWLQEAGGVADAEMRRTFNCGVGLILTVRPDDAGEVLAGLIEAGEDAFVCGELAAA